MSRDDFITEYNLKYHNRMAMRAQHMEYTNMKQGNMSITEVVRKFDQLVQLCLVRVSTEEEQVRRMLEMP